MQYNNLHVQCKKFWAHKYLSQEESEAKHVTLSIKRVSDWNESGKMAKIIIYLLIIGHVSQMFAKSSFIDFRHRSDHLCARKVVSLKTSWASLEMAAGVVDCRSIVEIFYPPFFRRRRKRSYWDRARNDPGVGAVQISWNRARQSPKWPPSKIFQRHAPIRTSKLVWKRLEKEKDGGARSKKSRRGALSLYQKKKTCFGVTTSFPCWIPKHK